MEKKVRHIGILTVLNSNSVWVAYNTCGKALAVAGDRFVLPDAGTFLLRSTSEFVEFGTAESTKSATLWATMEVLDVGGSAGATPFTIEGVDGSWGSHVTAGSGWGEAGGFGSSKDG